MTELEKSYWQARYTNGGHSGYGSYGEQLAFKLGQIGKLPENEITSISEFGCGDFNFGKHVMEFFPNASYTGCDLSEFIIEKNTALYPFATFTTLNMLPRADLVLCVDVLFHVYEPGELENILKRLEDAWAKYLVITAYERDEELKNHVRVRKFDPTRFGTPLIREVVEKDGELYFYVFKK